jgi:hypothetical protein
MCFAKGSIENNVEDRLVPESQRLQAQCESIGAKRRESIGVNSNGNGGIAVE